MIIAINMVKAGSQWPDTGNLLQQCFSRIARTNPQHQFIYIFDRSSDTKTFEIENITAVAITPLSAKTILWKYRYSYKLASVLKKNKIDVLISVNNCPLRIRVPQYLLIDDLSFLFAPKYLAKDQVRAYKKTFPKFLTKAGQIATLSPFSKKILIDRYHIDEVKIDMIGKGIDSLYSPIDQQEKESIKGKYSDGKEYFLFYGSISPANNMINLLKAFSHFKKWQKSNLQLIIAGKVANGYQQFKEDLKTYKYRNEVKLLEDLPEHISAKVLAAAYALVHPVYFDDMPSVLLAAFACGVPVITSNTAGQHGSFADAALYADPDDLKDIALQMILVFKDEYKRNQLIARGELAAVRYNWDDTASRLWASILKITDSKAG